MAMVRMNINKQDAGEVKDNERSVMFVCVIVSHQLAEGAHASVPLQAFVFCTLGFSRYLGHATCTSIHYYIQLHDPCLPCGFMS